MAPGFSPNTSRPPTAHPPVWHLVQPPLVQGNANSYVPIAGSTSSSSAYPDVKSQQAFEKGLVDKTAKQTGDIILYDNRIVLYKMESDVMIYVVGSVDENEILLYNTILALRDSLHLLFK